MANLKSAIKRVRSSNRKAEFNKAQRSKLRTALKKARQAIEEDDEDAERVVKTAIKTIDRAATRGFISKSKASRHKSQLTKALNEEA